MDSPLAEIRRQLALTVGENAVFDGWSDKAVASKAGPKPPHHPARVIPRVKSRSG